MFQLIKEQIVDADAQAVWSFVSNPNNLSKITPSHMGFHIKTKPLPKAVYAGCMIEYTVKPLLGIPLNWITEITVFEEGVYFVDEQRKGPYKMWHHEHFIEQRDGKVYMKDIISYIPPFGILGKFLNWLFIRKQLDQIFKYREEAIKQYL